MAKGLKMETWDEKKWRTKEDLNSLVRACEVRKDPERMKAVKAMAKELLEENKERLAEAQKMIDLGEGKEI